MFGEVRSVIHARSGVLPEGWLLNEVIRRYVLDLIHGLEWRVRTEGKRALYGKIQIFAGDICIHEVKNTKLAAQASIARIVEEFAKEHEYNSCMQDIINERKRYALGHEKDHLKVNRLIGGLLNGHMEWSAEKRSIALAITSPPTEAIEELAQAQMWGSDDWYRKDVWDAMCDALFDRHTRLILNSFRNHLLNGEPLIWKEDFNG